jgi:hypothetical protein
MCGIYDRDQDLALFLATGDAADWSLHLVPSLGMRTAVSQPPLPTGIYGVVLN